MPAEPSSAPSSGPTPYYLANFERALAWIDARYADVLDETEHTFIATFAALPLASRALLVRMLMRKGPLFRASRLVYDEIGCPLQAAGPLVGAGWLDSDPLLTLDDLFALATKPELLRAFPEASGASSLRKAELLDALRDTHDDSRTFADWNLCTEEEDRVLHVTVTPLCDRLRLMFFGNLHQDWSEFVLADLGVYQYERVAFAPSSRAFQRRGDVDAWLALHACRGALDTLAALDPEPGAEAALALADEAGSIDCAHAWLEMRRAKLLFLIGQHCERRHDWDTALDVYTRSAWPGARHRRARVLERSGRDADAFALALQAVAAPESDEEHQRIARMLPRLQRKAAPRDATAALTFPPRPITRGMLVLPRPDEPTTVECVARDHLARADAPVYFVENALINSLFGLLCWDAIFAAIPGAFFHPFQREPADLHAPDFRARRADVFAACFAQLDSTEYRATIRRHFASKAGLQSPFVSWGLLTDTLLDEALACLPAAHLKHWFERLSADIRSNRSGLPDLVQFWPAEQRYELIEIKGPGDRLQDNQIRWLAYCAEHGIPVRVLDVRWAEQVAEARA